MNYLVSKIGYKIVIFALFISISSLMACDSSGSNLGDGETAFGGVAFAGGEGIIDGDAEFDATVFPLDADSSSFDCSSDMSGRMPLAVYPYGNDSPECNDEYIYGNRSYLVAEDLYHTAMYINMYEKPNTGGVCDVNIDYFVSTSTWAVTDTISQAGIPKENCFVIDENIPGWNSDPGLTKIKSDLDGYLAGASTYEIPWDTYWDAGSYGDFPLDGVSSSIVIDYVKSNGQSGQISATTASNEVTGSWNAKPGSTVTVTLTTLGYQVTRSQQIPGGGGGDPPCEGDPQECA